MQILWFLKKRFNIFQGTLFSFKGTWIIVYIKHFVFYNQQRISAKAIILVWYCNRAAVKDLCFRIRRFWVEIAAVTLLRAVHIAPRPLIQQIHVCMIVKKIKSICQHYKMYLYLIQLLRTTRKKWIQLLGLLAPLVHLPPQFWNLSLTSSAFFWRHKNVLS